ncbi:MAG: hypothetical protein NTX50_13625 [Candidatus Sumerlaeota bacterium]|nr:hypothetical protein [Candidatus Sumerlaeota bacterium]
MSEISSPRGTEPAWIRPPAGRAGERGKSRAARALGVALLCLAIMAGAVFAAGYEARFLQVAELVAPLIFHPVAFIFLVMLGLEFIILKSGDRTRLLQVELDMIRAKRRNEVTVLRLTREGLERIKRLCEAPQANLENISKETNLLLEVIRPPEAKLLEKTEK